jgi:hypothetical protein
MVPDTFSPPEAAIKSWWNGFAAGDNKWMTISQNCSTVASEALIVGLLATYEVNESFHVPLESHVIWGPDDVAAFATIVKVFVEGNHNTKGKPPTASPDWMENDDSLRSQWPVPSCPGHGGPDTTCEG